MSDATRAVVVARLGADVDDPAVRWSFPFATPSPREPDVRPEPQGDNHRVEPNRRKPRSPFRVWGCRRWWGRCRLHRGEHDRAAIGVGRHHEARPRHLLGRPKDGQPASGSLALAGIRIDDHDAHGRGAHARAGGRDAALVMSAIVAMQNDASRSVAGNDDVVLEDHRRLEGVDVELLGGSARSETYGIRPCCAAPLGARVGDARFADSRALSTAASRQCVCRASGRALPRAELAS